MSPQATAQSMSPNQGDPQGRGQGPWHFPELRGPHVTPRWGTGSPTLPGARPRAEGTPTSHQSRGQRHQVCPQAKSTPNSLSGHRTVSPTVSRSCPQAKGSPMSPLGQGTVSSSVSPSPKILPCPCQSTAQCPQERPECVPKPRAAPTSLPGQGTASLRMSPSQRHPYVPDWGAGERPQPHPQAKSTPVPLSGH